MSTEAFQQSISVGRDVLGSVNADQLHDPTPCASWDVSELINHVVGGHFFFTAGMHGDPVEEEGPDFASGDYMAAFEDGAAQSLAAFSETGALEKMVTLPFGQFPGAAFLALATTDSFTHAWDLAKATGQSTDLAPDLAATLLEQNRQALSADWRGPEGAPFGPEQSASDGASAADQLAAFLGRQA
jgi:uncharacterized protein (TIGR03086 family)